MLIDCVVGNLVKGSIGKMVITKECPYQRPSDCWTPNMQREFRATVLKRGAVESPIVVSKIGNKYYLHDGLQRVTALSADKETYTLKANVEIRSFSSLEEAIEDFESINSKGRKLVGIDNLLAHRNHYHLLAYLDSMDVYLYPVPKRQSNYLKVYPAFYAYGGTTNTLPKLKALFGSQTVDLTKAKAISSFFSFLSKHPDKDRLKSIVLEHLGYATIGIGVANGHTNETIVANLGRIMNYRPKLVNQGVVKKYTKAVGLLVYALFVEGASIEETITRYVQRDRGVSRRTRTM